MAFASDPSGASARTSRGDYCPATPCVLELPRNQKFSAVFSKRGYHDGHAIVETFIANDRVGAQGNILFGFTPGAAVDAFDGGAYYHRPNPVSVTLEPIRAGARARNTAPKENPLMRMNQQPPPSIEDYLKNP